MATRNLVPRANGEGSVGTNLKKWLKGYFDDIYGNVTGNVTGNLTGDVTGNLKGNVTGNVTGNVAGNLAGNVTGSITGVSLVLKRSTNYAVGDIAYSIGCPSWGRLECVTAGITADEQPTMPIVAGTYISDGTAKFILDDVRDGATVGSIGASLYLPVGYIKANGATVNRADYPRLVALANTFNLWTATPGTDVGKFGNGNGSTTMVLPNFIDRMVQPTDTAIGTKRDAGMPNITGDFNTSMAGTVWLGWSTTTGAFYGSADVGNCFRPAAGYTTYSSPNTVALDASRSNSIYGSSDTVQPAAINMIPCIKY